MNYKEMFSPNPPCTHRSYLCPGLIEIGKLSCCVLMVAGFILHLLYYSQEILLDFSLGPSANHYHSVSWMLCNLQRKLRCPALGRNSQRKKLLLAPTFLPDFLCNYVGAPQMYFIVSQHHVKLKLYICICSLFQLILSREQFRISDADRKFRHTLFYL